MKIGAVVLAAGIPGRMKEFRPMLLVGKKPMIRHVVDTLAAVKAGPILVVVGYRAEAIERCLEGTGARMVYNRDFARTQMFDSLLLGLRAVKRECDRVIVTPADVPLVSPATLSVLLGHTAAIVRPVFNGCQGHPLILSREAAAALEQYRGGQGLRGAVAAGGLAVRDVEVRDEGVLLDTNTREDYDRLLAFEAARSGKGTLHLEYNMELAVEDVIMDNEIMHLLEMVEFTGSLQTASECVNLSYAKSWRRIKELENQLGVSVLQSAAGGQKGGGSRLTEEGRCLLAAYQKMQEEGRKMMNWLFREYFPEEIVQKIQNFK